MAGAQFIDVHRPFHARCDGDLGGCRCQSRIHQIADRQYARHLIQIQITSRLQPERSGPADHHAPIHARSGKLGTDDVAPRRQSGDVRIVKVLAQEMRIRDVAPCFDFRRTGRSQERRDIAPGIVPFEEGHITSGNETHQIGVARLTQISQRLVVQSAQRIADAYRRGGRFGSGERIGHRRAGSPEIETQTRERRSQRTVVCRSGCEDGHPLRCRPAELQLLRVKQLQIGLHAQIPSCIHVHIG